MSGANSEIVLSTRVDTALDVISFVASAVPWVGGPISNVLSGYSGKRKMDRVAEVMEGFATQLHDFKSKESEEYVKTEEFEELLENTLRRAADERSQEKRLIYRAFLVDSIKCPGQSYNDQIRFLRALEELQPDHLSILVALGQEPVPTSGMMGSPLQTLTDRLEGFTEGHIKELVEQLNAMRLTKLTSLHVMMTASGAQDLQRTVTAFGQHFLQFLRMESK